MSAVLKRITYVEDEPDIRAVVVLALEKLGNFIVDACPSGKDALERTPLFRPDLVLLDVMMPGMSGEETLQRLKKMPNLTHVPMAFVTARTGMYEVERYHAIGAASVIPKPFDPMILPQRVHRIWREYHQP
jgi:CheY-like chemotaxis protein